MDEQNIWEGLDLSEDKLKTAYDYLMPQSENFSKVSKGKLHMDVEVARTKITGRRIDGATLYTLSIVVPNLGNFRKKILHIIEYDDTGRFPVYIYNYLSNILTAEISEEDFLKTIKAILAQPVVVREIETLYRQAIDSDK